MWYNKRMSGTVMKTGCLFKKFKYREGCFYKCAYLSNNKLCGLLFLFLFKAVLKEYLLARPEPLLATVNVKVC